MTCSGQPLPPTTSRSQHLHLTSKLALTLLLATLPIAAQTPTPTTDNQQPTTEPPHGEVLFESHGDPPTTPENTTAPAMAAVVPDLPNAARSAIAITAYDLDARLTPSTAQLTMRARLTLRNTSAEALPRIALQISSTLKWESITLTTPTSTTHLPLAQHQLETDADHTGTVSEAIITLPQPLAPGASLTLDTLYSGAITMDSTRLERIGASPSQALDTDWDAIGRPDPDSSSSAAPAGPTLATALRGFGDVLWYPVSSPPMFLGDGAKLFQAVGHLRLTGSTTTIHLHLAVEYHGDPPTAAYFCGRRQPLVALPDDPNQPIAAGTGIATSDFAAGPIGFRVPSLFLVDRPETLAAPLPTPESSSSGSQPSEPASPAGPPMLAVATDNDDALKRLAATSETIAPLLQLWLGPHPLTALTILDHFGQPFQDGPLLVAPLDALAAETSVPALVHSLTHAWVQTGQPWFDEGLPAYMGLLWTEQQHGREAAIAQLADLVQPVNLAESTFTAPDAVTNPVAPSMRSASRMDGSATDPETSAPEGHPLISASGDLYYRRKAAAVWWMLRSIAGDEPLISALTQWRTQPVSGDSPAQQAIAFEHLLEKTSGKELKVFFDDWVLHDRGLPDLTLAAVEPRELPAGKGHSTGWLVAVTVRNDGAAIADVPLIVRSGALSTTSRIRIPGFTSFTDRVVVEAPPTEVQVNDGSTPEVRSSIHTQKITITTNN